MQIEYFKLSEKLFKELNNPLFKKYYDFLIEKNKVMNLTNITLEHEVKEKHFYDSIILSSIIDLDNKRILDIGAGAGFPSIPLKIINNNLLVTIIDGLNKRIQFLDDLTKLLNLQEVKLIHGRAEELDKNNQFDLVTARAVARLNILQELALPYVKLGGYFVAYKSINYQQELDEAEAGIIKLGGLLEKVIIYEINNEISHAIILIKKVKKTPSIYPRSFAKIKKSPLTGE